MSITVTKVDSPVVRDGSQRSSSESSSWEDRLFLAINQGDMRTVRALLKKGVNVNATHPSGRTPLGTAAHLGNVEILKLLLEPCLESSSNDRNSSSKKKSRRCERMSDSCYHSVSHKGRKKSTVSIEKRLKATTQAHEIPGSKAPLRTEIRRDSVSSEDETINVPEKHGRSLERCSIMKGDNMQDQERSVCDSQIQNCCSSVTEGTTKSLEISAQLEKNQGYFIVVHKEYSPPENKEEDESETNFHDENVEEPLTPDDMDNLEWDCELDTDGYNSPFEEQAENSETWIDLYRWYADYLAKSCSVDKSVQQNTSLHIDVNQLDMYRRSAMHYAAEQGNMEVLHILFRAGCFVDIGDSDDITPLHLAAVRDNQEAVAFLISCGAKVNRKSIDGTGPLHLAAARGFMETASTLLENGASVNAFDRSDRTPLLLAVSRGLEDMVKLLISHGAKVNVEDILGYTPLCQAVWQQEKEIVSVLLAAGAKLTHSDRLLHCSILHRCPDIAKLLISAGSIVNLRDDSGDTPLIIASRSGQIDVVNLLLHNGAMASYPNGLTGSTPLHEAVECLRPAQYTIFREILFSLLGHCGPSGLLNVESSSMYDTPLVRALVHDKDHAMILLIQYGADVNILQQHTPVVSKEYLQKRPNRLVIAQLMVSAGLNLWHYTDNTKSSENYSDDSPACWIASIKSNPMSLAGLSRLRYRLYHGENLHKAVCSSGLPVSLRKFILLEDIVNVDGYVCYSK